MTIRLAVAVGLSPFLTGCFFECADKMLREVASPDGAYIATVFERDCGATTDYARIVMIREKGEKFVGDRKKNYVFTIQGKKDVDLQWENGNHLVIARPSGRIFKEADSWRKVRVSYIPLSPGQ